MWSSYRDSSRSIRKCVKSIFKVGERDSRSWHGGRQVSSPMDPPVPGSCLSHFPIWCCISGEFTPEIMGHLFVFIKGSLCSFWSYFCSTCKQVKVYRKTFSSLQCNTSGISEFVPAYVDSKPEFLQKLTKVNPALLLFLCCCLFL